MHRRKLIAPIAVAALVVISIGHARGGRMTPNTPGLEGPVVALRGSHSDPAVARTRTKPWGFGQEGRRSRLKYQGRAGRQHRGSSQGAGWAIFPPPWAGRPACRT